MTLWILLTLMIALAAAFLVVPMLRAAPANSKADSPDLSVYRDQLAETDRDIKNGTIEKEQGDAIRTEIERRMLDASSEGRHDHASLTKQRRGLVVGGVVGTVAVGAIGLYASIGRPDLAHSRVGTENKNVVLASSTSSDPVRAVTQASASGNAGTGDASGSMESLIARLAKRLESQPDDSDGWQMLGWSYYGTGRYTQAAKAYAKAEALTPNKVGLKSSLGEALVRVANGWVTPRALKLFDEALTQDAKDPRARYFKGVERQQADDTPGALKIWRAMLKESTDKDTWVPELRKRIASLSKSVSGSVPSDHAAMKQSGAKALKAKSNAHKFAENGKIPGPTADDIRASQSMNKTDQAAMIRGMVDGLAKRLDASPRDASGWIKLMRSRVVLGEKSAAEAALKKALAAFADTPAEQKRIKTAAKQFGIVPSAH